MGMGEFTHIEDVTGTWTAPAATVGGLLATWLLSEVPVIGLVCEFKQMLVWRQHLEHQALGEAETHSAGRSHANNNDLYQFYV